MNKTPNMTLIFIAVAVVASTGVVGGIVLTIHDKDASSFYGFFTATLTSVVGFAALARSTGKIGDAVDRVSHNVNGRMTQLMDIAYRNDPSHSDRVKLNRISSDSGIIPTINSDTPVYDKTIKGE